MREIVLDTETTGLDPFQGHRLIEIGCIELINRFPSGQNFHRYVNPERDVPAEAIAIHGLSAEFLRDKPRFDEIADELAAFIADAPLVAHNAMFDLGFLNAELERAGKVESTIRQKTRSRAVQIERQFTPPTIPPVGDTAAAARAAIPE